MIRKTVTLVFCDVSGSTALGEALDAETVRGVMSRFFATARTVLERHGGTVEKFVGDAVMAAFGIPVVHEDDALRAVRAAVELRGALIALNAELERDFGVRIAVRTGVNTGEVVAGDPSLGQDFATGEAVALAQRLESAADSDEILLGDATYRIVRNAVTVERLPPVEVKGRAAPVGAWRLLDVEEVAGRRLDTPLVGRVAELELLVATFRDAVAERRCRLVTVIGDAGVGKSRLVAELVAEVGDEALVLQGRCLPYGRGITYWPLVEIVRAAAGIAPEDGTERAREKIAALLEGDPDADLVAARVADAAGLGESGARSEELSWAARRLLEVLSRRSPLLVVIDDVQWAEATLLDLVEYLAGWTRDAPVLLCCLARPDLRDVRPLWRDAAVVDLTPLAGGEVKRLIGNALGSVDEVAAGEIVRLAEGNPLFAEEILRMLVDDESLVQSGKVWVLARDVSRLRLPATITSVLAARLDRLPVGELAVLQCAAVIGQEFWWGAVTDLCPDDERPLVAGLLHALVRRQLIQPHVSALAGEDNFRFGHILVRDTAYESIPKRQRADLHERFAEWLETRVASGQQSYDEIVGYHLEQGFRYRLELSPLDERAVAMAERAGSRLAAAGRRALTRSDIPAAVSLLERAVSLLGQGGGAARTDVAVDLGRALRDRGDLQEADTALASAIDAAEHAGDLLFAEHARIERADLRLNLDVESELESVLALAEHAIATFEQAGDEQGLARALRLVADVHWGRCRLVERKEVLERALVHATRAGDQREAREISVGLCGVALFGPMPVAEGIDYCHRILEQAADDRRLQAFVQNDLAVLVAAQGRFDEARAVLERAQWIFDELGVGPRPGAMYTALVELLAGDPAAAERELRISYEELERRGERSWLSTTAALLARALYEQGRYEDAGWFSAVSEEAAARDDIATQVIWRATRARILALQGELDGALELARESVELAVQTDWLELHAGALVDLAEVLAARGDVADAALHLKHAVSLYVQKGNVVLVERTRTQLDLLAGLDVHPPTR